MTGPPNNTDDALFERLERLLDAAIAAARAGDGIGVALILEEGLAAAERLAHRRPGAP